MNEIVYHIASGQSFFSGVALLILAALIGSRSGRVAGIISGVCFLIGVLAVVMSTAAIPVWVYAVWGVVGLLWFLSRPFAKFRLGSAVALVLLSLVAAAFELPYHFTDPVAPVASRTLTVLGDSISSGVGGERSTWPEILASTHDLQLDDKSNAGASVASAVQQVGTDPDIESDLVIIELGGNDILGLTSAEEFESGMDELLKSLTAPGRQLVMLELPLPPLDHKFAYAQRRAAKKHGVALVPKRVLLSALTGDDATIDSLHLTDAGHDALAQKIWKCIGPAYGPVDKVAGAAQEPR